MSIENYEFILSFNLFEVYTVTMNLFSFIVSKVLCINYEYKKNPPPHSPLYEYDITLIND